VSRAEGAVSRAEVAVSRAEVAAKHAEVAVRRWGAWAWLAMAAGMSVGQLGCGLLSKGESVQPRYYDLEPYTREQAQPAPTRAPLHLGDVTASAHLRDRMVAREPNGEVTFYDDRRWTEKPSDYLRRALSHSLFQEAGLQEILHGDAPVVDVELLAFEEMRAIGKAPTVRVRVNASLHDDRVVVWQDTLTVDAPIPGPYPATAPAIVNALNDALHRVVHQVANQVVTQLRKLPPAPT
jgi:cholesterol transport system auxiliary component